MQSMSTNLSPITNGLPRQEKKAAPNWERPVLSDGLNQPPKSSYRMFSSGTPSMSSIRSTACSIMGGPQM
jgi:hypothetical protein